MVLTLLALTKCVIAYLQLISVWLKILGKSLPEILLAKGPPYVRRFRPLACLGSLAAM